jgi:hypothetical protein
MSGIVQTLIRRSLPNHQSMYKLQKITHQSSSKINKRQAYLREREVAIQRRERETSRFKDEREREESIVY